MSNKSELIAELIAALGTVETAESVYKEKRAEALAARSELSAAERTVKEIEEHLRTGSSGRPIIDKVGTMPVSERVNGSGNPTSADSKENFAEANMPATRIKRKVVRS
jgi:hypothetical protein